MSCHNRPPDPVFVITCSWQNHFALSVIISRGIKVKVNPEVFFWFLPRSDMPKVWHGLYTAVLKCTINGPGFKKNLFWHLGPEQPTTYIHIHADTYLTLPCSLPHALSVSLDGKELNSDTGVPGSHPSCDRQIHAFCNCTPTWRQIVFLICSLVSALEFVTLPFKMTMKIKLAPKSGPH